jgi:hypothetical protein
MKKTFLFFTLFLLLFCCNGYADGSLDNNDMSELFPELPELSEPVKFEPDPEDLDNDGLKNTDEERYGTNPNDPDTDNDGLTDFWEVTNSTDPNSKNTTGYSEVADLETENKDSLSSADIIDADDLSGKIDDIGNVLPVPGEDNNLPPFPWDDVNTLPEETGEKETENADEYMGIIPPILDNEGDLALPGYNESNSISKESLNDLVDEENNQEAMLLDSPSSGFDLTPILMLLLLNDNDNDGIDDDWEVRYFGSTDACDPEDDPDDDNLSNLGEYNNHTDPNESDTDGEGLTDGFEVLNGLNPTNADSDDDTMADCWEVAYGLNPLVDDAYSDLDNDWFPNNFEFVSQTDPTDPNSHPSGIVYNFNYDNNGNLSAMQRRE